MVKTIHTEKIPIRLWLEDIEPGALQQAKDIANIPAAAHHVAIMPDCHQGFGMPIGGVLATRDVVIPNAVGVDIGCGVSAVKTTLQHISRKELENVTGKIKSAIPVGFKHHKSPAGKSELPEINAKLPVVEREYQKALYQVGTLGGGNHFIEIQSGSDGYIWIMIHSGSRNIGKQVADHYYKKALISNERLCGRKNFQRQLACLETTSEAGKTYINEMNYCISFAFANRKKMTETVSEIFSDHFKNISFADFINIAHNYASIESHFGETLVIHRKGATSAKKCERCIIPGSQGSQSFIARGLGNKDSFNSCSHGAGRTMGRKEAQRTLNLKKEQELLDRQGILHSLTTTKNLDEAAGAYKNINQVMKLQSDLVEIVTELNPLAVIKG